MVIVKAGSKPKSGLRKKIKKSRICNENWTGRRPEEAFVPNLPIYMDGLWASGAPLTAIQPGFLTRTIGLRSIWERLKAPLSNVF